jgi:hypothetical protein
MLSEVDDDEGAEEARRSFTPLRSDDPYFVTLQYTVEERAVGSVDPHEGLAQGL